MASLRVRRVYANTIMDSAIFSVITVLILGSGLLPSVAGDFNAISVHGDCRFDLGMESQSIPDGSIRATSSFETKSVGPLSSRIRTERFGGAWCPRPQLHAKIREYLEIDLDNEYLITMTETQGRFGNGQGQEYAEFYMIEYFRASINDWKVYKNIEDQKILDGNSNPYTEKVQILEKPFVASKVRFVPYSAHLRTVCMRVEVYGCLWRQNITSYSTPLPDTEFNDSSYDGIIGPEGLKGGLGQLTDNILGEDDFLDHANATYRRTLAGKWVGWLNDDMNKTEPIDLVFEFSNYVNIQLIMMHVSHFSTRDVKVFHKMEIMTSLNGQRFYQAVCKPRPPLDQVHEGGNLLRFLTNIPITKFVKLRLHFQARWILISEAQFKINAIQPENIKSLIEEFGISVNSLPHQFDDEERPGKVWYMKPVVLISAGTCITALLGTTLGFVLYFKISAYRRRCAEKRARQILPLAELPTNNARPRIPITAKDLEITTPITESLRLHAKNLQTIRYRDPREPRSNRREPRSDHIRELREFRAARSAGNIYTEVRDLFDHEDYVYHEPYQSVSPQERRTATERPARRNTEFAETLTNRVHFPEEKLYETVSMCNLSSFPIITPPQQYSDNYLGQDLDTVTVKSDTEVEDFLELYQAKKEEPSNLFVKVGKFSTILFPKDMHGKNCECCTTPKKPLIAYCRAQMELVDKLGEGAYGWVHVCNADIPYEDENEIHFQQKQVFVKSVRRGIDFNTKEYFYRECNMLATIEHKHMNQIIGVCYMEEPIASFYEYLDFGHLPDFMKLQVKNCADGPLLDFHFLVHLAFQVASAMKYLEGRNIVHRDLAARNCMVGKGYILKVCDFAMYMDKYKDDYFALDDQNCIPLRWTAWEAVTLGEFTTKSDMWSYGITLWEIMNYCEYRPYQGLSDDDVLQNCLFANNEDMERVKYLNRPNICTKDIFELMKTCWEREPMERPTFADIYSFMRKKNVDYKPSADI